MSHLELLPIIAAGSFFVLTLNRLVTLERPRSGNWILAAGLSVLFGIYTVIAVAHDGVVMFWTNHSANMIGNQVWVDLLLALGMVWFLIARDAKKLGMKVSLWLLFIMCSGSVGALAMVARYTYLKNK